MGARTLKALKGSIKKWEGIVAGTEEDENSNNCPLCKEFAANPLCGGCPVATATMDWGCHNTPWIDWDQALRNRKGPHHRKATDDETVMCAVLELEFLKGLLP